MVIRLWEPNFKASMVEGNTVDVWVRLNELHVEYYDIVVLWEIGNAIGSVLKVDANTALGARGRYACICVQIDFSKPLVRMILIRKLTQGVIYKGIGALYFACGRVGRRRDGCPYMVHSPKEVGNVQQQEGDRKATLEAIYDTTEEDGYGPWMVVNRKKASPRRMKPVEPTIVGGNSSLSLVSPLREPIFFVMSASPRQCGVEPCLR